MHGNLVRIFILLGITRTSLNNVKVRCVGKDESYTISYVRNMIYYGLKYWTEVKENEWLAPLCQTLEIEGACSGLW